MTQAAKLEQAEALAAAINDVLSLHRGDYPGAQRLAAPAPQPVDEAPIRKRHEAEHLAGIGFFKRRERAAAKAMAAAAAAAEVQRERERREQERDAFQTALDEQWERLRSNEPEVVLAVLQAAFEDNDARAAVLDVEGREVELVVLTATPDVLPERQPSTTPAGNLSLKKMSKADRNALYRSLVCGHMLATVREAFAVAPGVDSIRVVAIRCPGVDSYGRSKTEAMLAARFERAALEGVQWDRAASPEIVADAATEVVANIRGQAKELLPIDLDKEPALAELIDHVDVEDLASP